MAGDEMTGAKRGGPPALFAWDVVLCDGGASGVTDDQVVALRHVRRVLQEADAESRGKVRRVTVGLSGRVEYVELGVVAEAWRDGAAVVWAW
ncbi:hypothetical protein GCM10009727_26480 [Actinomadura napierensis]|uniref:Uncharacterized protein n=2 Tax=Actinomadura napierensis TaxID=267854 RepID=A0ABP5KPD9_9ACTN